MLFSQEKQIVNMKRVLIMLQVLWAKFESLFLINFELDFSSAALAVVADDIHADFDMPVIRPIQNQSRRRG